MAAAAAPRRPQRHPPLLTPSPGAHGASAGRRRARQLPRGAHHRRGYPYTPPARINCRIGSARLRATPLSSARPLPLPVPARRGTAPRTHPRGTSAWQRFRLPCPNPQRPRRLASHPAYRGCPAQRGPLTVRPAPGTMAGSGVAVPSPEGWCGGLFRLPTPTPGNGLSRAEEGLTGELGLAPLARAGRPGGGARYFGCGNGSARAQPLAARPVGFSSVAFPEPCLAEGGGRSLPLPSVPVIK